LLQPVPFRCSGCKEKGFVWHAPSIGGGPTLIADPALHWFHVVFKIGHKRATIFARPLACICIFFGNNLGLRSKPTAISIKAPHWGTPGFEL
jgi:hypothetical protein